MDVPVLVSFLEVLECKPEIRRCYGHDLLVIRLDTLRAFLHAVTGISPESRGLGDGH
jgi:hypothetical protein